MKSYKFKGKLSSDLKLTTSVGVFDLVVESFPDIKEGDFVEVTIKKIYKESEADA